MNASRLDFRGMQAWGPAPNIEGHGSGCPRAERERPKVVSERLGHSTVGLTLDTYSHLLPGVQEPAVEQFDVAMRAAMEGGRK